MFNFILYISNDKPAPHHPVSPIGLFYWGLGQSALEINLLSKFYKLIFSKIY
jgi:hypothetical protein